MVSENCDPYNDKELLTPMNLILELSLRYIQVYVLDLLGFPHSSSEIGMRVSNARNSNEVESKKSGHCIFYQNEKILY